MSSLRFLSVHGGSVLLLLLLLLLTAVCEAEYYSDSTTPSEYDSDYNSTIEYSFFSNSSVEELEKFIGGMIEVDNDDEEEVEEEEEVSFTTAATPRETTERSKKERGGSRGSDLGSSASLPVCLVLAGLLNHLKRSGLGPFEVSGG